MLTNIHIAILEDSIPTNSTTDGQQAKIVLNERFASLRFETLGKKMFREVFRCIMMTYW